MGRKVLVRRIIDSHPTWSPLPDRCVPGFQAFVMEGRDYYPWYREAHNSAPLLMGPTGEPLFCPEPEVQELAQFIELHDSAIEVIVADALLPTVAWMTLGDLPRKGAPGKLRKFALDQPSRFPDGEQSPAFVSIEGKPYLVAW